MIEDYTEKQKIRDKADRDSLTGLYNRNSSKEKIEILRKTFEKKPGIVHAYVILDIDNFKVLNDTLGHQIGDQALQDIRITASVGVALISDADIEIHEMYRRADEALYQVKREKKNSFKIYEEEENGQSDKLR